MLTHLHQQPQNPKRVVILGARGFIGKKLKTLLEVEKMNVLALGSDDLDLTSTDAHEKLGNLLHNGDAVVFLSCLTPDKGKDLATFNKNIQMCQSVIKAVETKGLAQLIYLSSDAVYDVDQTPVSETKRPSPSDLYGQMHFVRETALKEECKKGQLPLCVLRPVAIFGHGDTHNSYGPNRFVRSALKERKITLFGEGEENREHIWVEDVAQIILLCLKHRSQGDLNLSTGKSLSFWDVAQTVKKAISEPEIQIECLKRGGPITHKHFDSSDFIKSFPNFRWTSLTEAISRDLPKFRESL